MDDLREVTITAARYGGTYESGRWVAFACAPHDLPEGWAGGDSIAAPWWADHAHEVGGGDTRDAAWQDLLRKVNARKAE